MAFHMMLMGIQKGLDSKEGASNSSKSNESNSWGEAMSALSGASMLTSAVKEVPQALNPLLAKRGGRG